MKYEIILSVPYVGREIYLLKIEDKFLMVYKSSGLAGHDSKGTVLPFLYVDDGKGFEALGWIVKAYMYGGQGRRYYSKELYTFPDETAKVLQQLTDDLASTVLEQPEYPETFQDLRVIVEPINAMLKDAIGDESNIFDFKSLEDAKWMTENNL